MAPEVLTFCFSIAQLVLVANAQVNLEGSETSNIILTLRNPLAPIYQRIKRQSFSSRYAKIQAMSRQLRDATRRWHAPILADLERFNVETESYWISNTILVRNANQTVIDHLSLIDLIRDIVREIVHPLLPIIRPFIGTQPNGTEWGVRRIGAEQVWNTTKGEGVKVAIIDTGVRRTHAAIRDNWVGAEENGWFDAVRRLSSPVDGHGHGTHCTGVICGNNGIGVAPAAKWLACRACDTAGCYQGSLLACGQWVLCPTEPSGMNPDCTKAPDIVSNSWGVVRGGGNPFYNDIINAWDEAGIIPFFAIGNDGPECETASSPGDQLGVISVGSTNFTEHVSSFSSRGPKRMVAGQLPDGQVAPLIVAPGENINSAYHLTDNSYQVMSGTSMATPHAAGAAALLLSRKNDLTREEVEELLFPTTFKGLRPTGQNCGANGEGIFPNDVQGYGRIDINAALNKLLTG